MTVDKIEKDQLTLNIDQMLHQYSYKPSTPTIYRVSDCLRSTKEKAYDPMIIAIGPFHHGKEHLKPMEHLKMRYLKQLMGDSSVDKYVNVIKGFEQTARNCYSEDIGLDCDKFVLMLLLDGIFIIQFLREYNKMDRGFGHVVSRDDPIFRFGHVLSQILHDLVLFENQIPLFILLNLFDLSKNHDQEKFHDLICPSLSQTPISDSMPWPKADHLLGLVHHVTCFSFSQKTRKCEDSEKMETINSATELKEAGVDFKKPKDGMNVKNSRLDLDITFKNKTIYMPELEISDLTESSFRNMIAYEYYLPKDSPKYNSDYAFFLHCLVHGPKDAELLRRYGVISNLLGGDARVYELVDRLGTNVQTSEKFSYSGVFRSVNHHCRIRRNRWIAVLRRKHFNSPWASISLVAAVILLSVGIVQMVYAVLSFYRDKNLEGRP